jgi:hypothetical protein
MNDVGLSQIFAASANVNDLGPGKLTLMTSREAAMPMPRMKSQTLSGFRMLPLAQISGEDKHIALLRNLMFNFALASPRHRHSHLSTKTAYVCADSKAYSIGRVARQARDASLVRIRLDYCSAKGRAA